MLLCRVVLGNVGAGQRGLRRPPARYGNVRCGMLLFVCLLLLLLLLHCVDVTPECRFCW
jgi:hypothetical protein